MVCLVLYSCMLSVFVLYKSSGTQKKNLFVVENLLTVDTREEDGVTFEMNINGDVFFSFFRTRAGSLF